MAGHAALAEATLKAGLHLLIEKPFTASLAEARALIETARARGRILMVSQNYRYHAPVVAAAELLRSGRYGRPISASIEFRQDWKATGHRYHDIPGPLLLDMGIHHFDMLRMILGADVRRVACRSWNTPSSPFRDHAAAHALLELETGLVASYSGSWLRRGVATTWTGDWTIECEAGELSFCARPGAVVPPEAGRLFLRRLDGRVEELPIAPLPAIDRAGALDAFARTVLGDRSLAYLPLAADNIASLATAFACMRSGAEDGRWITVGERAAVS
jgi:predicted dehydrogenase